VAAAGFVASPVWASHELQVSMLPSPASDASMTPHLTSDGFWAQAPQFEPFLSMRRTAAEIAARYPAVSPDELARASTILAPQIQELADERAKVAAHFPAESREKLQGSLERLAEKHAWGERPPEITQWALHDESAGGSAIEISFRVGGGFLDTSWRLAGGDWELRSMNTKYVDGLAR